MGWGIGGFCPGPALVASVSGALPVLFFLGAMISGVYLHRLYKNLFLSERS
jgi:uncharacterized membrane protein YedE/YeeE